MRGTVDKRGSTAHWKVVNDPKVQNAVRRAANSVADMNRGIIESDDMYQEGLILVAGTPQIAEKAIAGDLGLVYNDVRERLYKKFVRTIDRTGELSTRKYSSVPIEDADDEPNVHSLFDDGSGDYTLDAVRLLLPAVWDESYAYSLPDRDDAPSQDMPRAAGNKARTNNHWAYIADIKTGWKDTPLTLSERRALFLSYGAAWKQSEIARHEGVVQSVISDRLGSGIKKITARLNGATIA